MDVRTAETVAQSDRNSIITSGGGFSNHHLRPEWQSKAVADYHTAAATAGLSPAPGYNVTGRGYPDIAVAGKNSQEGYYVSHSGRQAGRQAPTRITRNCIVQYQCYNFADTVI